MSVANCHTCERPLDDQEIIDAGMECICHQCWDKRWFSSREGKAENEKLEAENKILKDALESVNDHAETCSIFVYDEKGCTCFYEKILKILEKIK